MKKQRPGISRASEFILNLFINSPDTTRLPSIRKCALSAGVSFVTMWKAIQQLLDEGLLAPDKNGFCKIVTTSHSNNENSIQPVPFNSSGITVSGKASRTIADKIFKDIVSGRFFGCDTLPSCKELQQYYKVSFITLKKSLQKLVDDEIVEHRSNSYYIPSLAGSTGHARLVAIGCGWEDGKILVDYQDKNYFRTLESECIRMNLQLDVVVYYRSNERLQFVNTASQCTYDLSDRTIIGFVFIVANLESNPEEVLERLVLLRRNVAVLDVVGGWKIPRCAQENRFVQIFTVTASAVPARRVAQYLLSKGHHTIAFFSPFHKALWSQKRLDTIIEMYKRADIAHGGVTPFVHESYAYQWDYLKNQEHQGDIRSLIDQYTKWRKETHAEFFNKFGNLGYSIVKYITEWNCASGEIYEKMVPFFDRALEDTTITAWVMANDFAATLALDYLKDKGIRVPEDISMVSFDNTLDAMEYHLTSYDFNNQGIISMMLRYIVAPQTIKPAARRGGFIEVDGVLVERRSTAGMAVRQNASTTSEGH